MKNIEIRKAGQTDFEEVFAMIQEFAEFIGTPEKVSTSAIQMWEEKDHIHCLVATYDGEPVGFATYFPAYYSWSGRAIYLDDLYVRQAHRGLGIGSALIQDVIRMAKEGGFRKVKWQVSKWNHQAIGFYKSLGAVIDDVEINCDLKL